MLETAFLILLIFEMAAAAYVASLLCRLAKQRQRKPEWYLDLVAASAAGGFISILAFFLLRNCGWDGQSLPISIIPISLVVLTAVGNLPAMFVVWLFRKRFQANAGHFSI